MSGVLSRNSLEHAVAGSAATCLATLLLFPLDRVKTLIQVDPVSNPSFAAALVRILESEGVRGLYRGCGPMLQTVSTSNFLYFFLFEGLKARLSQGKASTGPYVVLAASALAGALNMTVTEPLWRACIVAQASERKLLELEEGNSEMIASDSSKESAREKASAQRGVFKVVKRMWVEEGPAALWRGLGSSLWLVSNPVIQFFVYDMVKVLARDVEALSSVEAFLMGALAKAIATVMTFPLQVAQSRLRAAQRSANEATPELGGMISCLRDVHKKNGIAGLYFGLAPKLLQTVTTAALMFMFYEKIHKAIRVAARTSVKASLRRRRIGA